MQLNLDALPHIQNFFQLNFLFSGLEISSSWVFVVRIGAFLLFSSFFIWTTFKIIIKLIDCIQTLFQALSHFPKSFFVLLLLVIPLSGDSLGAKWIGYILLAICLLGTALLGIVGLVIWKYGVDQALKFINTIRSRSEKEAPKIHNSDIFPPDNVVGPVLSTGLTEKPS